MLIMSSNQEGVGTPSSKPVNPYTHSVAKSTPKNPYSQTRSQSAAPSTPPRTGDKLTATRTSVRNPYVKKTSRNENRETNFDLEECSATKRALDFSDESAAPQYKKTSPPRPLRTKMHSIDPSKTYTLYFDGGSRGNPGAAGAGMVIYDDDNKEIWNGKQFIGYQETNNVAEYTALITGLECAARLSIERIQVKGDSKLVVKQVSGGWYCKAQHLRLLLQKVLDAKSKFKEFDISHVDRNENQRADQLANIAMDKRVTDLGSARYSFKTPTSSQEDGDDMQVCTSEQNQTNLISTFDNAAADEVLASLKLPPGSRMDSNTFEVLVNPSSFDDANFDAELSAFDMTPFSQKACGACVATQNEGLSNNFTVDYSFEDEMCEEELCLYLRSQEIIEHVEAEERSEDDPNLPFLVQFEIERLNLRNNLGIKEICNGKSMTEMITTIHSEVGESLMPSYYNFLDHCLTNGYKVDESNSCLFLFHAKVLPDGIELLPPEPADVMTRRIHRKYGSHRFLDLRFDEKCTETPPTFMKYFKQHFTSENKLQLAGRKWGVIYSNPSETPVILRLFAESGVGISKSDEMTAPQVAAHCIPRTVNPDMNPDLTLSQYMKRMQLNFTSTIPSFKLEAGMLVPIPEIFGGSNNENEMTDGCGLISREALNKVWSCWNANIEERVRTLGRNSTRATGGACPYSSFQGRIGGIKGMFVVDDSLDGLLVLYRPSQPECDDMYNIVDIKEWDRPPPPAHLNQSMIQLLEERGVPKAFFLSLAEKEISEVKSLATDRDLLIKKYKATKYLRDTDCMIDDDVLFRMLTAFVPLDEPLMMCKVNGFVDGLFKTYREKSKYPILESRYLRMLPDHTGLLEPNEAYVALGDESVHYDIGRVGNIIAMRIPSYFSGDIRKLKVVSKAVLLQRCPEKSRFFCGLVTGVVLSTQGTISEAEMMSGGDFDGDIAWCCWNEEIVNNVQGCTPHLLPCPPNKDPWKRRQMDYNNPDWTSLVLNYTMHHRRDKQVLGKIATTLTVIRDNPNFSQQDIDYVARKAFIQVDNPHTPQWNNFDDMKYGLIRRPHWHAKSKKGSAYTSTRVLGQLYDMLDKVGKKDVNYFKNCEPEMNIHIVKRVTAAKERNADKVDAVRDDMHRHLTAFNQRMRDNINKSSESESDDNPSLKRNRGTGPRLTRTATQTLCMEHRSEILRTYKNDEAIDLCDVFAILYEVTYIRSIDRMQRFNAKPYIFAWEVAHDYLTRIIADGESYEGCAPTVARGKDRVIFGR